MLQSPASRPPSSAHDPPPPLGHLPDEPAGVRERLPAGGAAVERLGAAGAAGGRGAALGRRRPPLAPHQAAGPSLEGPQRTR